MIIADDIQAGIDNLFFNCMEAKPGETLTIVRERGDDTYYSNTLADVIAAHGLNRELDVRVIDAPFLEDASEFPEELSRAMEAANHTLFLARIGDQVRFTKLEGAGTKIMCYALDEQSFATLF